MTDSYTLEVLEAATHEYVRHLEGYGEHRQTYLICLIQETYGERVCWVVTVWNVTRGKITFTPHGRRRFTSEVEDEARAYYADCLYPKRSTA